MTQFSDETRHFVRRILMTTGIVALFAVLLLLAWQIAEVLLVVFGAILFAVLLDGLYRLFQRWLPMPRWLGLSLVVTVFVLVATGVIYLGSPGVGQQIAELNERFPQDVSRIKSTLSEHIWGQAVLENVPEPREIIGSLTDVLGRLGGAFSTALGAITNSVIIVIIGFYIAIDPGIYNHSFVLLFPRRRRPRIAQVLAAIGHVLRWWLIGRFAAMVAVGIMTTIGLWIIDLPLAMALGFIAGLFSFVPFIGPITSSIPAILIALVEGPWQALYVILIYSTVQFLEGNLITPLIQRRAVSLPPAALLIGQLLMGVLFGLLGILLATPLIIAAIIVVQMVYIEDVLNDSVPLLGEHGKKSSHTTLEY